MAGAKTNVRNRIRTLRFHHGEMTQQQLADAVGVSRQTLNAIETGKYAPSLEAAFRIARALNTPLEEVFQYADEGPASGRRQAAEHAPPSA